jgi:hypothetical protein
MNVFGSSAPESSGVPAEILAPSAEMIPQAEADTDVVVGTIFSSKDTPYVVVGVIAGVIQPYLVGHALKGNSGVAVNVATGAAALGIGLASRYGYIKGVPREANAALIGYGAAVLAITLLTELLNRWG